MIIADFIRDDKITELLQFEKIVTNPYAKFREEKGFHRKDYELKCKEG